MCYLLRGLSGGNALSEYCSERSRGDGEFSFPDRIGWTAPIFSRRGDSTALWNCLSCKPCIVKTVNCHFLNSPLRSCCFPAHEGTILFSKPAVQAWIAAGRMGAAKFLTEELYEDLGSAIDTQSLLAGGEATAANGERVRVTFKRISANAP